ncbi:insulin-like growth factor-binding protein complex acid labile subunit [Lineus longissimus]|uniref:insulin-like growth factor-binding protein complex acid labile subunit n=1 Tax=Lineus longissimus TaxID=88925 RepID=UPI002B4D9064
MTSDKKSKMADIHSKYGWLNPRYLLLLTLLQWITTSTPEITLNICPNKCKCMKGYLIVDCRGQGLTKMPENVPMIVERLLLDNNRITNIPNDFFRLFTILSTVSIENNELQNVNQNAFRHMNHLEKLTLAGNKIQAVDHLYVKDLHQLQELDLSRNLLQTIPDKIMWNLGNLRMFNVSYNRFVSPKLGDGFEQTSNLHMLDLSHNNLSYFEPHAFDSILWWAGHTRSLALNLSYCNIQRVDAYSFGKLYQLEKLVLEGNTQIPPRQLRQLLGDLEASRIKHLDMRWMNLRKGHNLFGGIRLAELEHLDLSHNGIYQVQQTTFSNLTKLKYLNLNYNEMKILAGINGMHHLEQFHATHNMIKDIPNDALQDVPSLKMIDITSNFIEQFTRTIAQKLIHLQTLSIGYNKLKDMKQIAQLQNLEVLTIQKNQLTDIDDIYHLVKLQYLDASHNEITRLYSQQFPSHLSLLNLSSNQIGKIDLDTFISAPLKLLDLSYNKIEYLRDYGWMSIMSLNLCGNKITTVESETFHQLKNTLGYLDLDGNKISNLNSSLLGLRQLTRLKLGNNPLGAYIESHGKDELAPLVKLQELSIPSIGVKLLHRQLLLKLTELINLDLSSNEIIVVPHDAFHSQTKVQFLNLSNNKLQSVGKDLFLKLIRLKLLDLSHNPFHCTCELLKFIHWARKSNITIINMSKSKLYKCMWPEAWTDIPLTELHFHLDSCMDEGDKTIIYVAIGFLIVLAVLALVLTCYFIKCCLKPRTRRDSYCELTDDGENDTSWV